MMTYKAEPDISHSKGGLIRQFRGDPNCAAFYAWVLNYLGQLAAAGHAPPTPPLVELTNGQKGNIGEFITFLVARNEKFGAANYTPSLAGALIPLQPGTAVGLDIMVLFLDPVGNTANDRLYIQEVKATGAEELTYAEALVKDYKKLLDDTQPSTALQSRISAIKAKLHLELNWPLAKIQRVEDIAQPDAKHCTRIRLMPTLVHDLRHGDPAAALNKVIDQIYLQGWPDGTIEGWSIAITRLNEAMVQMANRKSFTP
ncbi:hypothetical protein [Paucibacter sp. M5-1]|uniref:hypothetical protein n=1 Tax=Paucibacter sp. M5-1 TaxID=3015998 RepID=UPI0022B91932|nr:hypothetical protein [Paucibacter sp. M5-1]MCZ7881892.1 hypothetical protein [Paucibacter sp. M5-1]